MIKPKIAFSDSQCGSYVIPSTWIKEKKLNRKSAGCQTSDELYQFKEMFSQSGAKTTFVQDDVGAKYTGKVLIDFLCGMHKKVPRSVWEQRIRDGFITIDSEISTDSQQRLEAEAFVEFVDYKVNTGVGTDNTQTNVDGSSDSKSKKISIDNEMQTDPLDTKPNDEKAQPDDDPKLATFLKKVLKWFDKELDEITPNSAFELFEFNSTEDKNEDVTYWKCLSVDLEKRKVLFPDWTNASHMPGNIIKTNLTRNKERVCSVEYEDGVILHNVREEYIRLLSDPKQNNSNKKDLKRMVNVPTVNPALLLEGVRVHARVTSKAGITKYYPSRIVKAGKGLFDVEIEGNRIEKGLTADNILIGLVEGQKVEARKPSKMTLQCTGLSWNVTGNVVAASFGRNDITGWCDFPGAICCWNVFGKTSSPDSPDFVLDHTSCLMSVAYHPESPALIAGGSFNGEVIVWDLTNPEQPLAVSPIIEYSHKEPVLDIKWMYDPALRAWLIISAGADGRVLYWNLANKLIYPVKGVTLTVSRTTTSKRHYPQAHGATSMAFSTIQIGSSNRTSFTTRPQWAIIGQESGTLIRSQVARLMGGPLLNSDSFNHLPNAEDLFPPLKKLSDDLFHHHPHIGSVSSVDCSPFNRNLFLSAGGDGTIHLSHMLQRDPIQVWEVSALPGTRGISGQFSAVTAIQFSPIRPLVFAAATADGFVYLFDLQSSSGSSNQSSIATPVASLEAPLKPDGQSRLNAEIDHKPSTGSTSRAGLTGLAFNHKQRDLIAACDCLGRVHIWKLSWNLSNVNSEEMLKWNEWGNLKTNEE